MAEPQRNDEAHFCSVLLSSQILLALSGIQCKLATPDSTTSLKKRLRVLSKGIDGRLRARKLNKHKLTAADLPLAYKQANGEFSVLAKLSDKQALVQRVNGPMPELISSQQLDAEWAGEVIQYHESTSRFDVSWFIPEFVRHKRVFTQVLLLSLLLQLLALTNYIVL